MRNSITVIIAKYNYNDQIKKDELSHECSRHGEKRSAYRVLVGKPGKRRVPGRPRHM
jgi:hypothetical protein